MGNPYEILGVREGATPEEIKAAYRGLVKKYHPDRYEDNPLQDLADEKMREINEAYDYFEKINFNQGGYNYEKGNNNSSSSNSYRNPLYDNVRGNIKMNNLRAAEQELNKISDKTAEWFYLSGVISMQKGWYNQGYKDLQTAVDMDPQNYEYREYLNSVANSNNNFTNNGYTNRTVRKRDFCDDLTCLCCTDSLCECLGGDLCTCC